MSIRAAILEILHSRASTPAEMAERMSTRNRATFYRVLSGDTADPRISTFIELCNALKIAPSDLLRLAGLYESDGSRLTVIDVELRHAFTEIQQLSESGKQDCLELVRRIVSSRGQKPPRRIRRRRADV